MNEYSSYYYQPSYNYYNCNDSYYGYNSYNYDSIQWYPNQYKYSPMISSSYNYNQYQSCIATCEQCRPSSSSSSPQLNASSIYSSDLSYASENNSSSSSSTSNKPAKKKLKRFGTLCEICGDISSGFHYGVNTCEACKLFFIRTTKNKRKRKFAECQTKRCVISLHTRSLCSECRFRKCLTIGMSIENSRYGRHVSKEKNTQFNQVQNSITIQSQLTVILNDIKWNIETLNSKNSEMNNLTNFIQIFYAKSTKLIDSSFLDSTSFINSTLNEYKLNMLLILFCQMFDIKINISMANHQYNSLESDLKQLFSFYNRLNSSSTYSSMAFRCVSFIHIMFNFIQDDNDLNSNCMLQKNIFDLLRYEMGSTVSDRSLKPEFSNITASTEHFQWLTQIQNILNKYLYF